MMTLRWLRAELTEEPGRAVRRLAAFALATTCVALVAGCAGDAAGGAAGEGTQEVFSTRSQSVLAREEPKVPVPAVAVPQLRTDPAELRTNAINLLQLACESEAPILRANGIEALRYAPEYLDGPLRMGLTDENRGVRFNAAWMVGDLRLESMVSLVEPLLSDPSESVQAAAIYAMHRCNRPVDPSPLGRMVMSADPEIRGNAAMAIGEIGDPSALAMLDDALGIASMRASAARMQLVDLQIAAASVKLGDERDLEVIRAAFFAPPERGAELTLLACELVADLGDLGSVPTLKELASRTGELQPPAEIRMTAVQALARLEPSTALSDVPRTYIGSERFELRALAASTLGETRDESNLPIVGTMLGDQSPMVQVAAAKGILMLTD